MKTNLRRRIAIGAGVIAALVTMAFAVGIWILVSQSLESATDRDLARQADDMRTLFRVFGDDAGDGESGSDGAQGERRDLAGRGDAASQDEIDAADQALFRDVAAISTSGELLFGGDLPVSEPARRIATGESTADHFETITVGDRRFRVLTTPAADLGAAAEEFDVGAMQISRDITDAMAALRESRSRTLGASVLAGLAASGLAWLLSRRLVAPVQAVADAADRLRPDRDVPERLAGEGPSDLGRLVTSFNRMLDALARSRQQQEHLVADVSHELRTPLSSLRLKIEFLQSQPGLAVEQRQRMIDGAVGELESLSTLVDELVSLASGAATNDEVASLIDLAGLVEDEVGRFELSSGLRVSVSTTAGMVETQPNNVRRALSNLLQNAAKYGRPATERSTERDASPKPESDRCGRAADAPASIEVIQRGPSVEVRDHGPGIAEVDRDRVFDRFFRGAAHQSIEGNGLGLAMVAAIAEANGGSAWVRDPDDGPGVVVGFSVGPSI